jgi:hypothetical protein
MQYQSLTLQHLSDRTLCELNKEYVQARGPRVRASLENLLRQSDGEV